MSFCCKLFRVSVAVVIALSITSGISNCTSSVSEETDDSTKEIERSSDESMIFHDRRRKLFLSGKNQENYTSIELKYNNAVEVASQGPRVAEVFLKYTDSVKYEGYEDGEVLATSGKRLVVQNPSSGLLRLVMFSQENLSPIISGTLARLKFKKLNDDPAEVKIMTEKPIFAPPEANEGLLIGDPITI